MSFSNDNTSIINQLPITIDFGGEENFKDGLMTHLKKVSQVVNTKTGGLHVPNEKTNGDQYFTENNPQKFRNVYRVTVDFGYLPNNTTASVAHGINFNNQFSTVKIYGSASDQGNLLYLPLPYPSATNANIIELSLDATNVIIKTGANRSSYYATVDIEYLKN